MRQKTIGKLIVKIFWKDFKKFNSQKSKTSQKKRKKENWILLKAKKKKKKKKKLLVKEKTTKKKIESKNTFKVGWNIINENT